MSQITYTASSTFTLIDIFNDIELNHNPLSLGDTIKIFNIYDPTKVTIGYNGDSNGGGNTQLRIIVNNMPCCGYFDILVDPEAQVTFTEGPSYNVSNPITLYIYGTNNSGTNCPNMNFPCDNLYAKLFSTNLTKTLLLGIANSSLPISLSTLIAYNIKFQNHITWQTASEVNNSHFEIEHSKDGLNFKLLDIVKGSGTSTSILDYSYTHSNVEDGVHYYRLKQVDFDGSFDYSDVVSLDVNNSKEGGELQLFPNPSNGIIDITSSSNQMINVYDILGRAQGVFSLTQGQNKIDFSALTSGVYFIKNEKGSSFKFVRE